MILFLIIAIQANQTCQNPQTIVHTTFHPHLDPFWIYNMSEYYNPNYYTRGYLNMNRFSSVKQIYDSQHKQQLDILINQLKVNFIQQFKKPLEQNIQNQRTITNSQVSYFAKWFQQQTQQTQRQVRLSILYGNWEFLNGGWVQNDEACAYYDDILVNYEVGGRFLKAKLGYYPNIGISADSFGHSQTMIAILSSIGMNGWIVQRMDEHNLNKNMSLQYVWQAKSSNNHTYGRILTHIRWQIHGHEQIFLETGAKSFSEFNKQLKKISKLYRSSNLLRYFGHDFQMYDASFYKIVQQLNKTLQDCEFSLRYSNPTKYFTLLFQRIDRAKVVHNDIFPVFDFQGSIYWTGYFTTNPRNKKIIRDAGRLLQVFQKLYFIIIKQHPEKTYLYDRIYQLQKAVALQTHHDGITSTSKYVVHQYYQMEMNKITGQVKQLFRQYSGKGIQCYLEECFIDKNENYEVKVIGGVGERIIKIDLSQDVQLASQQYYQILCKCSKGPCPCSMYIFTNLSFQYTFHLTPTSKPKHYLQQFKEQLYFGIHQFSYRHNELIYTNVKKNESIKIGYSYVKGGVKPGKYALNNLPQTKKSIANIRSVSQIITQRILYLFIQWEEQTLITHITIYKDNPSIKIQTQYSARLGEIADYYLEFKQCQTDTFYTDSNGWLVMERKIKQTKVKTDIINGNTYPITAFAYYIKNNNKIVINTDRAQGAVIYNNSFMINFDRITKDDGKWVFQEQYKTSYQKFTHHLTIQNINQSLQRKIQKQYDQTLLISFQNNSNKDVLIPSQTLFKLYKITNIKDIKYWIRELNGSTIVRIQNLNDLQYLQVALYSSKSKLSFILSAISGSYVVFDQVAQMNIIGTQNYHKMMRNKWNLMNKKERHQRLMGEFVNLGPLQVRTYKFYNTRLQQTFQVQQQLQYKRIQTKLSYQGIHASVSKVFESKNIGKARFLKQQLKQYYLGLKLRKHSSICLYFILIYFNM